MKSFYLTVLLSVVALVALTTHSVFCMVTELTTLQINPTSIFLSSTTMQYSFAANPPTNITKDDRSNFSRRDVTVETTQGAPVLNEKIPKSSMTLLNGWKVEFDAQTIDLSVVMRMKKFQAPAAFKYAKTAATVASSSDFTVTCGNNAPVTFNREIFTTKMVFCQFVRDCVHSVSSPTFWTFNHSSN